MSNTAPLPKEIVDRIVKRSEGISSDSHEQVFWEAGAISEATRAQPLIEALEAWQNFDSRIHNNGDVALLHMKAHKALTEYNQQPTTNNHEP